MKTKELEYMAVAVIGLEYSDKDPGEPSEELAGYGFPGLEKVCKSTGKRNKRVRKSVYWKRKKIWLQVLVSGGPSRICVGYPVQLTEWSHWSQIVEKVSRDAAEEMGYPRF